jgi:hypothetical protein
MDKRRRTNSRACSYSRMKSLRRLSLGSSKVYCYDTEVGDVQDLQQRIRNGVWIILTTTGIFQRVRRSLFRRPVFCFEAQDWHSEHFL